MGAAWRAHADLAAVPPAEGRRIAEVVRAPWARGGPEMLSIREIEGPVRMRVYTPREGTPKPALVYLHGGGWTLFSLDTHDRVMREYASRADVVVVGVDYALAPEARYPVALDEVVAALRYLEEHGGNLGIDVRRIAVGGDSAGANLALAASLRLRDTGIIRAILLNYGVFARQSSAEAVEQFGGDGNMLTATEMEEFWRNYLRDESDALDPFAVPLLADLQGLPPVFLNVPECDLLAEQSLALEERLFAAGVEVRLELVRGAVHSFLEAVSISPLASRAFDDAAAWLRARVA